MKGTESSARTYPTYLALRPKEGKGIGLRDADGCRYIDCLAAAKLVMGNPVPAKGTVA
jgi:4-aminobutyrate aminotransferase-like enzyme